MGAWGHHPLANDAASDWKWHFGEDIIKRIKTGLASGDPDRVYHAIGMWDFMKERLSCNYSFFNGDESNEMNKLCEEIALELINDEKWLKRWRSPEIVVSHLSEWIRFEDVEDSLKVFQEICKSFVETITKYDGVDKGSHKNFRFTVKDGTCMNIYQISWNVDKIYVYDQAMGERDGIVFMNNIGNPNLVDEFEKTFVEMHNLREV